MPRLDCEMRLATSLTTKYPLRRPFTAAIYAAREARRSKKSNGTPRGKTSGSSTAVRGRGGEL